jgi:hypothetical protein
MGVILKSESRGLDALADAVRNEPEGNRNHLLHWAAMRAVEEDHPAQDIRAKLTKAARDAGLTSSETAATIRSGLRRAERKGLRGTRVNGYQRAAKTFAEWLADPVAQAEWIKVQKDIADGLYDEPEDAFTDSGSSPPPEGFLSIVDYRLSVPTNIPWVWHDFVYKGAVTILSGPPKAGKSTIATQLMRSRESGEALLDRGVARGACLLVTEEGGIAVTYKTRGLMKLTVYDRKAAKGEPFAVTLAKVTLWLKANPDGLVFIDTLAVWASVEDENDASQTTKAIEQVMALAQVHDAPVVIIHHTRKGGGQHGEAIRGSGAILATPDISIELKYTEDDTDERYLDTQGRVIFPERILVSFDRDTMSYSRLDITERGNEAIEKDLAMIPYDGPGVKQGQTGLSWRRLDQLVNKGRVRKQAGGSGKPNLYWAIPPQTKLRVVHEEDAP